MPTSLRFLSVSRALCMPTIPWAWSWIKTCMPWIPRPSTSACRCFPGHDFAGTKRRSRCIRCWTCMAASPRLLHYRRENARRQYSRPVHSRGGFVLRDGSRLCRFRKTHRRNHSRPENKGLSAGNGPLRCTAFMRFRGPQALKDNLRDTLGLPMPLVEIEACARCGK